MPRPFNLDHLQSFKPFLFWKFSKFFTFILGGQFLLHQRANNGRGGIHPTSKLDETGGFQYLGHSNWTICIHLSPFCSRNFPTFSHSYWEANYNYPRGPIIGKRELFQPQKRIRQWVFSLGASKLDRLHSIKPLLFWKISNFFTFILGGQFLLPQRANNQKREFFQPQKRMRQRVSCAYGIQTWPFASH